MTKKIKLSVKRGWTWATKQYYAYAVTSHEDWLRYGPFNDEIIARWRKNRFKND